MATKKETSTEIFVTEQRRETLNFCIMGTTPLIHNRMSQKVLQTLLCPAPRKNAAEKAQSLKHNPLEEYRNSPYTTKQTSRTQHSSQFCPLDLRVA
jgi:hypothetical protein